MSSRLRSWNSTKISFFAFQDIITFVSGILILITLILATELDRPTSQTTHDADPELERKLSETLRQQAEVDTQNLNLQGLLAAAETAPATEKLESDITRLRTQLAEEKKKHASVAEQLAASQSVIEARDRTLGLTDLKAQIQRVIQEAEALARDEAKVRAEMGRLDQRVAGVQSKLLKLREREGKLWLIPERSSTSKEPILAIISGSGAKVERFDQPDQTREFSKASARTEFESYLAKANPVDRYIVFFIRPSGIELFDRLVKLAREKGFEVGFDALEEDKDVYFSTPPIPDETTPPPRSTASQFQPGSGGYSDPRGGAGEVGASTSGPGQKQAKATDADGRRRTPSGGSSTSTEPSKQTPTTAAPSPPPSAANDRSFWQRFLEWLGLSGPKGGSAGGRDAPSTSGDAAGGGSRGNAGTVSAPPSGSSQAQAGSGASGGGNPAGRPGTVAANTGKGAKGRGTSSGAGNGAASGAANDTSTDGGAGAGSVAGNANGPGVGDRKGDSSGAAGTNVTGTAASKSKDVSERKADTNSSAFTDPKKNPSPPAAQPKPPPPPKTKSWWQRFLEWIGLR